MNPFMSALPPIQASIAMVQPERFMVHFGHLQGQRQCGQPGEIRDDPRVRGFKEELLSFSGLGFLFTHETSIHLVLCQIISHKMD